MAKISLTFAFTVYLCSIRTFISVNIWTPKHTCKIKVWIGVLVQPFIPRNPSISFLYLMAQRCTLGCALDQCSPMVQSCCNRNVVTNWAIKLQRWFTSVLHGNSGGEPQPCISKQTCISHRHDSRCLHKLLEPHWSIQYSMKPNAKVNAPIVNSCFYVCVLDLSIGQMQPLFFFFFSLFHYFGWKKIIKKNNWGESKYPHTASTEFKTASCSHMLPTISPWWTDRQQVCRPLQKQTIC